MSFILFGIDIIPKENLYGIMFLTVNKSDDSRSLFTIYYSDGELIVELLFMRFYLI